MFLRLTVFEGLQSAWTSFEADEARVSSLKPCEFTCFFFFISSSDKAYEFTWFWTSSSEKPCEFTCFFLFFEAVRRADFAHALEVMRLHEDTERFPLEGVEIFHAVASEISISTLGRSIEQQGSFMWKKKKTKQNKK